MATRADIRTRARIRADQDKSQFPTDAQYDLIIDSCARTVYYDLIAAGWPIAKQATNLNLASLGFEEHYPINGGSPVHSITGVFRRESGGSGTLLKRVDESDIEALLSVTGGRATHYEASVSMDLGATGGPGISLYPPQFSSGDIITVYFIPEFPGFTSDAEIWRGPNRSDELIVLMAAAIGCRKEGEVNDAKALDDEYDKLWTKVTNTASWFDQRGVARIRDVESRRGVLDPFDFNVES